MSLAVAHVDPEDEYFNGVHLSIFHVLLITVLPDNSNHGLTEIVHAVLCSPVPSNFLTYQQLCGQVLHNTIIKTDKHCHPFLIHYSYT
jgi:hypothetical protein